MVDEITKTEERKTRRFYESQKFNLWLQYYTDKKNKETYFNATQSAIKAYQYDPETQYATAGVQGADCLKKAKALGLMYCEANGLTFDKMMSFAVTQMFDTKKKEWWDAIMKVTGYQQEDQPAFQVNVPVQINNAIQEKIDRFK